MNILEVQTNNTLVYEGNFSTPFSVKTLIYIDILVKEEVVSRTYLRNYT